VQGTAGRQKAAADHGYPHPGCLHLEWGQSIGTPAAGVAEEEQSQVCHAVASQLVARVTLAGYWAEDERKSGGQLCSGKSARDADQAGSCW